MGQGGLIQSAVTTSSFSFFIVSTATICQALPTQIEQAKAKARAEHTMEDWELVLEASLDPNSEDDEAMANLQKKAKEGCMKERTAERRQKREEEEQRVHVEAEWREREVAEQKRKEEEEAWRAEEAEKEAEEVAEVWRRAVDRQRKLSVVIPAGGSTHRSISGPSSGTQAPCDRCASQRPPLRCIPGMAKGKSTACKSCHKAKASCSWLKAARGVAHKQRRTQTKEDDKDDGEGDFAVPPALAQEHRDVLGTLTKTLSTLLKEFRGYCHDQWDLQACQVRGLKALQKEMKKANALKVKELEVSTKGKEKAAELSEESSESSEEEEEVENGNEGGAAEGGGDNRDRDVEMGAAPSASAM
ncbi:hypothetical protein ID866_11925 [Astraeus odoratus]|nr:hypothetical protein ID866_11925 [Astraeus odoratus]